MQKNGEETATSYNTRQRAYLKQFSCEQSRDAVTYAIEPKRN